MQAVILAAGKSTRTYPLTLTRPKPLLKAANKTLLEHNLDNLIGIVSDAIIVVGYKKYLIKKQFGKKYSGIKITYVEQKKQLGTGNALLIAEKYIKNEFISLYGDDIYSKADFENIVNHKYSILTGKIKNPKNFGVIIQKNSVMTDLIEKPKKFVSDIVNTGLYKLDKKIFPILISLKKSMRGEYELTDAIKRLSVSQKIHCVMARQWLPVGYPWDLLRADNVLRKGRNFIGKNSSISGNVKNSSIGENCTIKGNVINSIIMDNAVVDRGSAVEDSIIGENAYFKGRIISKNNVFSVIKNKRINAGRLGAIIGDNARAVNVIINPGCKIWPNKSITNKIIKQDVK